MISELHQDLRPYIVNEEGIGPRVNHPLVASPLPFEGIATINELYACKREAIEDAAASGDWERYIELHERPYRFEAMQDAVNEGADIPSLLPEVWIDSENIWQFEDEWCEYPSTRRMLEILVDGC